MRAHSVIRLFTLILCGVAAACANATDPGSGSGSGYSVATTTPAATTLGTSVTIGLSLPSSGAAGPVTVTASGLPASWTVTYLPSSTVTLVAGETATLTATITIPTNGAAAPTGQNVQFHAASAAGNQDASSRVTVANEFILPIAQGTSDGIHWGSYGIGTLLLRSGSMLTIHNDDFVSHIIATGGGIPGLVSEVGFLNPDESYRSVVGPGHDQVYCSLHAGGAGNTGRVLITVE